MASDPPWKSIVESLLADDFESPYLDRLKTRLARKAAQKMKTVQQEILEDMAYALRRSEDKVNFALLELDLASRGLEAAEDDATRRECEALFDERWERARRARWEYMVHRQAIGMRWSREIEAMFPLPPRRCKPADD